MSTPRKRRYGIRIIVVLSPLVLAYLWGGFVDGESFAAFMLGVLGTMLFGLILLVKSLIEKFGNEK